MKDETDSTTMKIVYNYFIEYYGNRRTAITEFNKLKFMLKNKETYKLVAFGNTVFLLTFLDHGVEFHSMGRETSAFAFTKNIRRLIDYVKELNVGSISTYGDQEIFEYISERMKLDIKKELKLADDGKTYNYYRLEF
jgi:hypothetical protein